MITASTELLMILKRMLESIEPMENPILLIDRRSICYRLYKDRFKQQDSHLTYTKAVKDGLATEVSFEPSVFSRRTAKHPVVPPMSKLTISRMLGIRSSFTILSQPRILKSNVAFCPAATKEYPYNPNEGINQVNVQ